MTFSFGTRTSSKTGEPVGEPLIPSLCSSLPMLRPGRSFSTMKHVIRRFARSVVAKTT
jgi:hypothetical protein